MELQQTHPVSYPASELLNHARKHGIPVSLPWGMSEAERCAAMHYGDHSSDRKEVDFVHNKIADQVQSVYIVVSPLSAICCLPKF